MNLNHNMIEILPAILATNFEDLKSKISRFVDVSKTIQVDVCDGVFVDSISWPMNKNDEQSVSSILSEEDGLPYWDRIDYEFDLMVENSIDQFEFFVRLGAKKLVFHLEAENEERLKEFLEAIDLYTRENVEIGLAINTTTDINILDRYINNVDFIQLMGIEHIGHQGEDFDERVLFQIKELKSKYSDIKISVDGSVNKNTAKALVEAGASKLVIGSALVNDYEIRESIKYFENL